MLRVVSMFGFPALVVLLIAKAAALPRDHFLMSGSALGQSDATQSDEIEQNVFIDPSHVGLSPAIVHAWYADWQSQAQLSTVPPSDAKTPGAVVHAKEKGGGYLKGSPLYQRQQRAIGPAEKQWYVALFFVVLAVLLFLLAAFFCARWMKSKLLGKSTIPEDAQAVQPIRAPAVPEHSKAAQLTAAIRPAAAVEIHRENAAVRAQVQVGDSFNIGASGKPGKSGSKAQQRSYSPASEEPAVLDAGTSKPKYSRSQTPPGVFDCSSLDEPSGVLDASSSNAKSSPTLSGRKGTSDTQIGRLWPPTLGDSK